MRRLSTATCPGKVSHGVSCHFFGYVLHSGQFFQIWLLFFFRETFPGQVAVLSLLMPDLLCLLLWAWAWAWILAPGSWLLARGLAPGWKHAQGHARRPTRKPPRRPAGPQTRPGLAACSHTICVFNGFAILEQANQQCCFTLFCILFCRIYFAYIHGRVLLSEEPIYGHLRIVVSLS